MSEDAKNLLGWFGKRKENVVHNGIRSHAIAVHDCVVELGMALRAMQNDRGAEAIMCLGRLVVNEREADSLEDNLCNQLSVGELSPQEREDLLHFVRKTDDVANWSKEAGLFVKMIKETEVVVYKDIWGMMIDIQNELDTEVNYLINAIKILGTNGDEMNQCIQGVKDQESRIDTLNYELNKKIFMSDMDPKAIMLSSRVVDALEQAADVCKGCADTITILNFARSV